MKIVVFDKQGSGCYHYRSMLPFEKMRELGHEIVYAKSLTEVNLEKDDFDIVVVNRILDGDVYAVTEFLKWRGIKMVYDTDDGLDVIPAVNPAFPISSKGRKCMEFFLREADLVTVTTERLANHVAERRRGKPVLVAPNCASLTNPLRPKAGKEIRIGYAGSITHIADLLPALDAIIALQDKFSFKFVLLGYTEKHDTWQSFVEENHKLYADRGLRKGAVATALRAFGERLSKIRPDVLEWHKAVPLLEYPAKLASLDLDLGICPLEDNLFNSMKSVCKTLEYATAGTSFLAQNVAPYSDIVPKEWLVRDWKVSLEKFLTTPVDMTAAQTEWVKKNFLIENHIDERIKAFESIL